jgi:predicted  nucleic acid-binding Zn-ribbon protein
VVQRKIEELQQTFCQMQKDHKKDREETLMAYKGALEQAEAYKVALEQAVEEHNKASNERDRLASENKKLREELKEYNDAFNREVEASSSPLWLPSSVFFPKNRSKLSPSRFMEALKRQSVSLKGEVRSLKEDVGQKKAELVLLQTELDRAQQLHHETVASLEGEVKSLKEDVGQKKAGMVWLQTELDRAQQLRHETDEKLYQCLCAVNLSSLTNSSRTWRSACTRLPR